MKDFKDCPYCHGTGSVTFLNTGGVLDHSAEVTKCTYKPGGERPSSVEEWPPPTMNTHRHLSGPFKIDIKGNELYGILTEKVNELQAREADIARKIEETQAGVAIPFVPKRNSPDPRPEVFVPNPLSEYSVMQR